MKVSFNKVNNCLFIYPEGEIDECSVTGLRRVVDDSISDCAGFENVVINLSKVKFMDSTGIGFLIGRYKLAAKYRMRLWVQEPNLNADKVLSVSGVYALIPKLKGGK